MTCLLAEKYHDSIDPTGYWASEKLDGYRALWNGHQMRTRSNEIIEIPDFFKKALPSVALDGELYLGRGQFEKCGIFRKKVPIDAEWSEVSYNVFDLPESNLPFEERLEMLKEIVGKITCNVKVVVLVKHYAVIDRAQLQTFYNEIVENGGEGVILRQRGSFYEFCRSHTLLKMKPVDDSEAEIIGYSDGNGRNTGRLGAFIVRGINGEPEGKQFKIGSGLTDSVRNSYKETHKIGTIISYQYSSVTPKNGVPRFPRYMRLYIA